MDTWAASDNTVTVQNQTALTYLTILVQHDPLKPFTPKELLLGRQFVDQLTLKLPPYMCIIMPPHNPKTISMHTFYRGHYVHTDIRLTSVHNQIRATMIRRAGSEMTNTVLFYYTMHAMDPTITIPRLLYGFNRTWEFDLFQTVNNQIAHDVRRFSNSLDTAFTPPEYERSLAVQTLMYMSGATLLVCFAQHPTAFERMDSYARSELSTLFRDADRPVTDPFRWEPLMTCVLLLHRMLQVTTELDDNAFRMKTDVAKLCEYVWTKVHSVPTPPMTTTLAFSPLAFIHNLNWTFE